jgi:hypothetical protein
MRLSQAPGEAAEFIDIFGELVREVHPDYERNKAARGVRAEYCREIAPGVYASHNAYCKKGRYHHGFCLTLHKELPTPYLLSPFSVGGRFDHNHGVNMAFQLDLKRHILLSDSHAYRKGFEEIIRRCVSEAEAQLLPHYVSVLAECRAALVPLAMLVAGKAPIPDTKEDVRGGGWLIGQLDCNMPRYRELFEAAGVMREQFLQDLLASKPELFQRLRKNHAIDPTILQKQ